MCYSHIWQNIRGDEYLCKLGKKYLNVSICKFVINSLQHSETFDVLHDFLPLNIAELSTLKQVRFFGPPCKFQSQCNIVELVIESKYRRVNVPSKRSCTTNVIRRYHCYAASD